MPSQQNWHIIKLAFTKKNNTNKKKRGIEESLRKKKQREKKERRAEDKGKEKKRGKKKERNIKRFPACLSGREAQAVPLFSKR